MAFSTKSDNLPYRFPEGLRVFIIDHDTTQLSAIADLCFQCKYEVTTCIAASFAVHLLRETKGSFDVIVIEAQMPDMDSYEFVQRVTQEIKIPIIMMGVDDTTNARMKAIEKGASEYWVKPLNVNHINNMWQHVVTIQEQDQILRILEVKTGLKIMNRYHESATKETNSCVLVTYSDNDNDHDHDHDQPPTKKNRISWSTPELEEKFQRAVNQLGVDKATPSNISKLMNVKGLTPRHVASHLQKVRRGSKSSSKKTKLKKELSKSESENSKQDQNHVPNNESLEVVQSMPMPMPMPEQNESLEVVQSMPMPMPMPEHNESLEVVQSMAMPMPMPEQNESLEVVQSMPMPMPMPEHNESLEVVQSMPMPMPMPEQNESLEVVQSMPMPMPMPENNESLEVVQLMPNAEKEQNVVLNSEAIQCDNNFPAQQHQQNVFDDFEISNMFTNNTNMMLDNSSSLLYDEAWKSLIDWC